MSKNKTKDYSDRERGAKDPMEGKKRGRKAGDFEDTDTHEVAGGPEYAARPGASSLSLLMFIIGTLLLFGFMAYVLVDEDARGKVVAFVRGDLFHMEKLRAEELHKLYLEKMEAIGEKYGDIHLQYFPKDARVNIYQTMFRFDDMEDKEAEEWGNPKVIPNASLQLAEGEELPYLSIENLPVRERGKLCLADGQFYPASIAFCPGAPENCAQPKEGEEMSAECKKALLSPVQYCSQDQKYYVENMAGIMVCPDGKTLMDPGKAPLFVFRYDFLFVRKDFLSQAVSYAEADWLHLGSGKYIIQFPKDFALLRAWGPVKEKYAQAREKMKCWRNFWGDEWENYKRQRVITLVKEKMAERAAKEEERTRVFRSKKELYANALKAIDAVQKVKMMATIRNGMAEVFYYCSQPGNCDPAKMQELLESVAPGKKTVAELDVIEKGMYYGVLETMKCPAKKWDGMEQFLAENPVATAGFACLQMWIPKQKEGMFVSVTEKECTQALAAIQNVEPYAYSAFQAMFVDQAAGIAAMAANRAEIDNYLLSVDDYVGSEKYEDLVARVENGGKFIEYLIQAVMYDYKAFDEALMKFARSRLVNYRRDCEKRGIVASDPFKGIKEAVELAWWTGSRLAFEDWYYRLWGQDVQGCLLFAKQHDKPRYERDLKRFEELVGAEKKGLRELAKGFKDFLKSLRGFEKARPLLKEANALFAKDRKAFFEQYSEARMAELKLQWPELYGGILYLSDPKAGKEAFDAMSELPKPASSYEAAKKEGDQKLYHKYIAYMDVFAPSKVEAGLNVLKARMEPMFTTEFAYEKQRESRPEMPAYRDAIRDIVNNDIHLKYFWLLRLLENPSTFDREFARLDLKEALEVSRWIDPERYSYLSGLTWMKEWLDRYNDSVPLLMDGLTVDFGFYGRQLKALKDWSIAKSKIVKKYRRGKKLSASLLKEPTNVEKALEKSLKQANRFALLAKNLQDYEEAVLSTEVANAMEELRDEMDTAQRESYSKHVELNNDKIRIDADFSKKEWENLTKEFEKTTANAEWYTALTERLNERRLDCSKVKFPEPKGWKEESLQ
jgi:hypothetical protein